MIKGGGKGKKGKKGKGDALPANAEEVASLKRQLQQERSRPKFCAAYLSPGGCPKGEACPVPHHEEAQAAEEKRASRVRKEAAKAAAAKAKAKAAAAAEKDKKEKH